MNLNLDQTQVTGWVACFRGLGVYLFGIEVVIGRESMAHS